MTKKKNSINPLEEIENISDTKEPLNSPEESEEEPPLKEVAYSGTSTTKGGKNLWQRLQEMPYDNSQTGQAFIMSWKPPKNATKRSKSEKE